MTEPLFRRTAAALAAVLTASAAYFHAADPLWNDEIYTLQSFVFKGLGVVCSDYHVPNNHILPNILHWLWLKAMSVRSIGPLLEAPWQIRLLPLALSAGTVYFTYRAGLNAGGKGLAWLAVVLLLSGATFQAYAFQVRGYALSMTAASALTALLLFWANGNTLNWRHGLGVALSSFALLYALPSNAYLWAAALLATGAAHWSRRAQGDKVSFGYVSGGLVLGATMAFVAYLPVFEQMRGSAYFESEGALRAAHFEKFGLVLSDFFSLRWLLLPLALGGAYFAWKEKNAGLRPMALLAALLLLPFLFSALRGDSPPERVFLPLLPALAVLLALGCWVLVKNVLPGRTFAALAAIAVYAALSYAWSVQQVRSFLLKNMDQTNHYYPGLNRNYYQHYFDPLAEYKLFREKHGSGHSLILESTEAHDLPVYLDHLQIKHYPLDSIQACLDGQKPFFVSSYYARPFMREIGKLGGTWRSRYLQNKARLPRVVVCEPTGGH